MYISPDLLPTTLEVFKIYRRYPLYFQTVRWLRAFDESRITAYLLSFLFSFRQKSPTRPSSYRVEEERMARFVYAI